MKNLFQSAMIIITAALAITSCSKEAIQSNAEAMHGPGEGGRTGNLIVAKNLIKKGTDSLVYNAGGTLTKVIYSPNKYVTYQRSVNKITASTFEDNIKRIEEVYTLSNGRAIQSIRTTYSSNIGVSKTWLYDYDKQGHLTEKYNKNNTTERMIFDWYGQDLLDKVIFYNASNQIVTQLQFQRQGQADKIKINSARSSLDPYLQIFGVPCSVLATNEIMTYPTGLASNFTEVYYYTYDREGYPTKMDIYDPHNNWSLIGTEFFKYSR
jgi:hypothetical protein